MLLALRHRPALLAAAGVVGVVVGAVAASPLLFTDAAGSGAVQVQWQRSCPGSVSPTINAFAEPEIVEPLLFRAAAAEPELAALDVSRATPASRAYTVTHADRSATLGVIARSGFADHVDIVDQAPGGDLWLPDAVATELGAGPGDTVEVHTGGGDVMVVVHAVFRDLRSARLDRWWCTVRRQVLAPTLFTDLVPPAQALMEASAAQRLGLGIGDVHYSVPFAREPLTISDATRLVTATRRFDEAVTLATEQAEERGDLLAGAAPSVTEGIRRIEQRALAVRRSIAAAIRPLALLAIGAAWALAGLLGMLWLRVKRNDAVALATLGLGPVAIAGRAWRECVVPVVAGAAGGALLGRLALGAYAPATDLEPGTLTKAIAAAIAAAMVATVVGAATAGVASRGVLRHLPSRLASRLQLVPWELGAGLLAWRSYSGFRASQLVEVHGDDTVISTPALTFPLLVFVTGAVLAARLWYLVMRLGRHRPSAAAALTIARRRLSHQARSSAALVACGIVAAATGVYGAGLVGSLARTTEAKAGVFVGSDAAFKIRDPLPPTPGAAQVLRRSSVTYAGGDVDVLAVDPDVFADAAFWDESFSDRSLPQLLAGLTVSGTQATALAVGTLPDRGALTNSANRPGRLDIAVIEHVDAFPAASAKRPTLVISADAAQASGFRFERWAIARGPFERWRAELDRVGAAPVYGYTVDDVVDSSELLFASWAFEFVRALGAFVGLQVVIAVGAHLITRQRKQALAFGLLRRMGFSGRANWAALAIEAGAVAAAIVVVGSSLAVLASRIVARRVDPLPSIPPNPLLVLPRVGIGAALGVGLAAAVGGALVAHLAGRRVNLAGVLRDDV